jgi:multidrug resistance efflux pump
VAGSGMIEAASENIDIGTPFPEIIEAVYVKNGDIVKKGASLYKLDTRSLEANLEEFIKQNELKIKILENKKIEFSFYENLKDQNAVSQSDYEQAYYDLQIAKKDVEVSLARINETLVNIKRSTIQAPIDGKILDINLHVGENAQLNPYKKNFQLLFGNLDSYHIRVYIDETDAWRVYKKAPATAYVRGNSSIKIPLEFIQIEPYVIPKANLTGANQERVDTRVLQVIYKFNKNHLPVYVGQLVDVYIEAIPSDYKYDEKNFYNN